MHENQASMDETKPTEEVAVSIVIPLFNEQEIIRENLEILAAFFDRMVGAGKWMFILVDNGSVDATPQAVEAATAKWPPSRGIKLAEPNYGEALKTGLRAATTKWVYLLDIEQWDLPFIAWSWMTRWHYDAFIASKRADPTLNEQHTYRRFLSWGSNCLLQILFQFTGTDTHGPKLLNRYALETIIPACQLDRGQFDTELVLRATRAGKRLIEIPVPYRESRPPRNWMVKKIVWNLFALRRLAKVMRDVPYEGHLRCYRIAYEDVIAESLPIVGKTTETTLA
jgi:glycosyltransferase involved in cell wall biosynthesis